MTNQTTLFDPAQYAEVATEPIREIPLKEIEPDPINPAQHSEKYSQLIGMDINVEEEEVERLVAKIRTNGYDTSAPIVVRPMPNGKFRLVRGHHTFVALWVLEKEYAPCIVREMTDIQAEVCLLTLQGRKVPDWYALKVVCHLLDKTQDLHTVALWTSIEASTITIWRISYKFINKLVAEMNDVYPSFQKAIKVKDDSQSKDQRFSIYEAREIGQLPDDDQIWFARMRLSDPMLQAKQVKLIRLLKETRKKIESSRWKAWLVWEKVRTEIYKQFSASIREQSELAELIPSLLQSAEDHYNDNRLPLSTDYYEVGKGAKRKTGFPKEEFLKELIRISSQDECWFEIHIDIAFKAITNFYKDIEEKYFDYLQRQAAENISKGQKILAVNPQADADPMLNLVVHPISGQIGFAEESTHKVDIEKRKRIFEEYTPRGFNETLTSYSQSTNVTYPVIITRITMEDTVIDEFFEHCDRLRDMLDEDGIVVILCPSDLSYAIIEELENNVSNMQKLYLRSIDNKPVSKYSKPIVTITTSTIISPFIRTQECFHLLVFTGRSDTIMREYGLKVSERGDIIHPSLVNIFCDPSDTFLDPFCTNGLLPYAAKSCGVKCDYIVSNEQMFARIQKVANSATLPSHLFSNC